MARLVSDYISGMTDRFALQEFTRLTGETVLPSRAHV
jgi:dGTPase